MVLEPHNLLGGETLDVDGEAFSELDATLMVQTAPEEAYRRFDDLSRKHIE